MLLCFYVCPRGMGGNAPYEDLYKDTMFIGGKTSNHNSDVVIYVLLVYSRALVCTVKVLCQLSYPTKTQKMLFIVNRTLHYSPPSPAQL